MNATATDDAGADESNASDGAGDDALPPSDLNASEVNDTEPDVEVPPPPEPVVAIVPIAWEGSIGTSVCVPMPGTCLGVNPSEEDQAEELAFIGDPRSLDAQLAWESSAPVNDELLFGLYARRSCGSDCFEYRALANVTGPSPLALAATIAFQQGETALILFVQTPAQFPPPLEGWVNVDQPFRVTGNLTTVVLAGG